MRGNRKTHAAYCVLPDGTANCAFRTKQVAYDRFFETLHRMPSAGAVAAIKCVSYGDVKSPQGYSDRTKGRYMHRGAGAWIWEFLRERSGPEPRRKSGFAGQWLQRGHRKVFGG